MLVDCFTFFNELDLLECRLEYLYNKVDRFVIVESDRTHTCNKKPLHFKENQARYQKYLDKIVYVVYKNSNTSTNSAWIHENAQRASIMEGLTDLPDDAWVMISDLDEIPNIDVIDPVINAKVAQEYTFLQDMFYYNFKQKDVNPWSGTTFTQMKGIRREETIGGPQYFRSIRTKLKYVANGGWHLSYWTTPDNIKHKIESFAHQEYNQKIYKDIENITESIKKGRNIFGTAEYRSTSKVDINTLPPQIVQIFGKCQVFV